MSSEDMPDWSHMSHHDTLQFYGAFLGRHQRRISEPLHRNSIMAKWQFTGLCTHFYLTRSESTWYVITLFPMICGTLFLHYCQLLDVAVALNHLHTKLNYSVWPAQF